MRLFAILVGGKHPRARIELHDVQFVIAPSIEAAVPTLRAGWWGTPSSLHIDAYAEIARVDGYDIAPANEKIAGAPSLYFVNTGGYADGEFAELHAYSFHVGADKRAIWAAAKARAPFSERHQDNFDIIDDIICIDDALAGQRTALALMPAPGKPDDIRIRADYIKLPPP